MKNVIAPFNWQAVLESKEVDAIGNDFFLIDSPIITSTFNYPMRPDVAIAIICTQGTMKGSINLKPYCTQAPCLFIVLHDQILQYEYLSEDFAGYFIIMSKPFLTKLSMNIQERVPLFLSVHENPWIPLSEEELEAVLTFYKMLQNTIRRKDNPYRIEIVKLLIQAFFYESGHQYHKITEIKKKTKQEQLLEKFLNYAQTNYKQQRGMEFYAEKLCLTPKYLSKVIKETSGKSANDWIDDYVVLEAKALLKSTNMTIQQISDELNFPSQSFFGKYFKRHADVSPKEYRKN